MKMEHPYCPGMPDLSSQQRQLFIGLAEGEDHNRDFWFAWREDTGLILNKHKPEEYDKIVSEAGELLEHTEHGMFSSHIVMRNLKKHP
jgi:hypothetical protein